MDFGTERRDRPMPVQISSAQMIRFRDEHRVLTFTLVNGTQIEGDVKWFDDLSYHVATADGEITLLRHAVLYYRAH